MKGFLRQRRIDGTGAIEQVPLVGPAKAGAAGQGRVAECCQQEGVAGHRETGLRFRPVGRDPGFHLIDQKLEPNLLRKAFDQSGRSTVSLAIRDTQHRTSERLERNLLTISRASISRASHRGSRQRG